MAVTMLMLVLMLAQVNAFHSSYYQTLIKHSTVHPKLKVFLMCNFLSKTQVTQQSFFSRANSLILIWCLNDPESFNGSWTNIDILHIPI